jgi:hypothetical protein
VVLGITNFSAFAVVLRGKMVFIEPGLKLKGNERQQMNGRIEYSGLMLRTGY